MTETIIRDWPFFLAGLAVVLLCLDGLTPRAADAVTLLSKVLLTILAASNATAWPYRALVHALTPTLSKREDFDAGAILGQTRTSTARKDGK